MKVFGFCVLLLLCLSAFSNEGVVGKQQETESRTTMLEAGRLKDDGVFLSSNAKNDENGHDDDLDDYRPIDPSPSSKASIRPKPIQHGTPYMPYIPKPSSPPPLPPPPGHPKLGRFP